MESNASVSASGPQPSHSEGSPTKRSRGSHSISPQDIQSTPNKRLYKTSSMGSRADSLVSIDADCHDTEDADRIDSQLGARPHAGDGDDVEGDDVESEAANIQDAVESIAPPQVGGSPKTDIPSRSLGSLSEEQALAFDNATFTLGHYSGSMTVSSAIWRLQHNIQDFINLALPNTSEVNWDSIDVETEAMVLAICPEAREWMEDDDVVIGDFFRALIWRVLYDNLFDPACTDKWSNEVWAGFGTALRSMQELITHDDNAYTIRTRHGVNLLARSLFATRGNHASAERLEIIVLQKLEVFLRMTASLNSDGARRANQNLKGIVSAALLLDLIMLGSRYVFKMDLCDPETGRYWGFPVSQKSTSTMEVYNGIGGTAETAPAALVMQPLIRRYGEPDAVSEDPDRLSRYDRCEVMMPLVVARQGFNLNDPDRSIQADAPLVEAPCRVMVDTATSTQRMDEGGENRDFLVMGRRAGKEWDDSSWEVVTEALQERTKVVREKGGTMTLRKWDTENHGVVGEPKAKFVTKLRVNHKGAIATAEAQVVMPDQPDHSEHSR